MGHLSCAPTVYLDFVGLQYVDSRRGAYIANVTALRTNQIVNSCLWVSQSLRARLLIELEPQRVVLHILYSEGISSC
jgi:hypothetical protein